MAIVRMFDNPNVTQEQYDESSRRVGTDDSNMPPGAILHVAGAGPDGWRVVEIWESEEDAKRFDAEKVEPACGLRASSVRPPGVDGPPAGQGLNEPPRCSWRSYLT